MSLRGTLGDFGIADIFQLIGHQQKTGVLLLKDREVEVRISFVDGNVVKAEQSTRDKADLLGNIMVRAGALTQAQLDEALATQQRTLRRLGDILVDMKAVDRATLKEFARLQTTETIYRLFQWRAGTYEFTAQAIDYDDASYEPIRSENILMEGFRMVDEWPAVRRVIPNNAVTFEIVRAPPAADAATSEDDDILAGMDKAFAEDSGEHDEGPAPRTIGATERAVFAHVLPGRTVADIIDHTRLGEFETCKALATLVQNGVLQVVLPKEEQARAPLVDRKAIVGELVPFFVRVLVFLAVAAVVGVLVRVGSAVEGGLLADDTPRARKDGVVDEQGHIGMERLRNALELYRVEKGRYPDALGALIEAGLVGERDLSFPFATPYAYRHIAAEDRFELGLPLR